MAQGGSGVGAALLAALLALVGAGLAAGLASRLRRADYRRDGERDRPGRRFRGWFVPLVGALWGLLGWQLPRQGLLAYLPAALALALLGAVLTWIDLDVHWLPNALVLPAYPAALALVALASLGTGRWNALPRAVLAGGACWVVFLLLASAPGGGLGFGDVKLAGVLGIVLGWLGWPALVIGTFASFVVAGLVALVLLVTRRVSRSDAIAFGPYLVAGALVGVLAPARLLLG